MAEFFRSCPVCLARLDATVDYCPYDGTRIEANDEDRYVGRELLGQFRIEAKIGAGGMGSVYRAHQRGVERKVAIKVLHEDLTRDADAVRRFQREAQVAASIDHANVVRVLLYGELEDGSGYIAMEYLDGTPLIELLTEGRTLSLARAIHITAQVCAGVGDAHARGIVHRDLKPENVILVQRGADADFVKVLDFGVARLLKDSGSMATQSGLVFGTARYISPEGAAGEPTDARSDVYSIGVMLFQLLAGETPFDGPTPVAIMMKHLQEPAPDVRARAKGRSVPGPVADVIAKALAKAPGERYADAKEMRAALLRAAALAGVDVALSSASMPKAKRSTLEDAMARASLSPRRNADDDLDVSRVSIPGLSPETRSPAARVARAFFVGAVVVFVAFAVRAYVAREREATMTEELFARAEAALTRGAIDTPPDDNVIAYVDTLRERAPSHPAIERLRRDAVRALAVTAERALEQELFAEARRDFERALAIDPENEIAQQGLATATERARNPEGESELVRIEPDEPRARAPVTLIAAMDRAIVEALGSRAHFHVLRNRQPVASDLPATWNAERGQYETTYTFAQAGTFAVVFAVEPSATQRLSVRGTFTVRNVDGSLPGGNGATKSAKRTTTPPSPETTRGPSETAPPAPPPPAPTPQTLAPPPASPPARIDWNVPP